jgi:putative Mg2+ transporter-C (MgtC) family protein
VNDLKINFNLLKKTMHEALSIGQFEIRLLLAFILGALIGLERQWQHKIAGIKTNALVAGGAALFILLSEKITGDPTSAGRIASTIVTGIGFLGAGVIMREGPTVSGINTSATIWCSGAIGSIAGMGYWYEGVIGTAFVLLAHILLRPLGNRIDKRIVQIESSGFKYSVKIDCTETVVEEIRSVLVSNLKSVSTLHLSSIRVEHRNSIFAEVKSLDRRQTDIETLVGQISLLNEVRSVKWEEVKA